MGALSSCYRDSQSPDYICSLNVCLLVASVFNGAVLGLMLSYEIKQEGFKWNGYKALVLGTLLLFQVLMFINFAFANQDSSFRVLLQTFEELTRGVAFFLVAMYFLKKCSKILNNKGRWVSISNIMVGLFFLFFVVTEIGCGIAVSANHINDFTACSNFTNLFLQCDQTLVLVFFFSMAVFITKRIKEQRMISVEQNLNARHRAQIKSQK